MRKLKIVFSTLCLVAVLTLSFPPAAYADGGSQGGSNSTTTRPNAPPPPPTLAQILAALAIAIS